MGGVRFPQVRDGYVGDRLTLMVRWTDGAEPVHYCGESHCTGGCGLPALVIPVPNDWGTELKARSSMTARGLVMQPWGTPHWSGVKAEAPEEHRAALLKAYWL